MTDAEIIKALECHIGYTAKRCPNCAYTVYGCDCLEKLHHSLYDLIKRQKAEIERLQKLQKPTGAGGFKIENGKVIFYSDMLNGYRHEYKDLEEIVKELNLYMHTDERSMELISHYKHKAQTAKTEAIKEFWEKAKNTREYRTCPYVYISDGNNLVKEMTEGDK